MSIEKQQKKYNNFIICLDYFFIHIIYTKAGALKKPLLLYIYSNSIVISVTLGVPVPLVTTLAFSSALQDKANFRTQLFLFPQKFAFVGALLHFGAYCVTEKYKYGKLLLFKVNSYFSYSWCTCAAVCAKLQLILNVAFEVER